MPSFFRLDFLSVKAVIQNNKPGEKLTVLIAMGDNHKLIEARSTGELVKAIVESGLLEVEWLTSYEFKLTSLPPGKYFNIDTPDSHLVIQHQIEEDFTLVSAPNVFKHDKVWAYLEELHKAVAGYPTWNEEADWVLYPKFRGYYQKVLDAMGLPFYSDDLEYKSRHRFFIGTEPFEFNGQSVAGVCGLAQLMGVKPKKEQDTAPQEEGEAAEPETGSVALDLEVSTRMVFKRYADRLLENYGLEDVSKMVTLANRRLREAYEKEDGGSTPKAKPKLAKPVQQDAPEFLEQKESIASKLAELNVPLPEGF